MITRMLSDEELINATALVREAMVSSLPEPQVCTGEFSEQFEERIKKLKKTAERKAAWHRFAKGAVAAILFVVIGFSILFAFSTETRAAVVNWFKDTFNNQTTYWFSSREENVLPKYALTWVPKNYEIIYDDSLPDSRTQIYQLGDDISASFAFSYYQAKDDSPLMIYTGDGTYDVELVDVNGYYGEFYKSHSADTSHALVWLDEDNNTVLTILSYMSKDDVLRLANSVQIVEQP